MMLVPCTTCSVDAIENRIAPLRRRLTTHPLYSSIHTQEHLRIFMESHVFAVWDFMSLLKALQAKLTCVDVPWVPTRWPESRRFINEIVFGEESDVFEGRATSHFEVYLKAMEACGASTIPVRGMLRDLNMKGLKASLAAAPTAARAFVRSTFEVIGEGSVAAMAAAFTFGREDVIPDIFRELVRELNAENAGQLSTFLWYLERHIEIDGDEHGPLSLRMVADLCGDTEDLWDDAALAAEQAIAARLALWDGILAQIKRA